MRRPPIALLAVAGLAGCGGSTTTPPRAAPPPHIPHALAQSWARQATIVAREIAAGDACSARDDASKLAAAVARSAYRVPVRLRTRLTAVVAALPGRIRCTPAPPATPTPTPPQPTHGPPPPHGHGHHFGHGPGPGGPGGGHGHHGGDDG